ncbi:MAG: CCA tRNA nucleotidyltransferase [Alistipes sp.]|nr:CCA tRNA nucleotidyltransferase [Alistipes sp.]
MRSSATPSTTGSKIPCSSTAVNSNLPNNAVPLSDPIFRRIARLADERGVQAFVVGGYVRDHYLRRPSTDIDVVVVGDGIELAEALGRELHTKVSIFKTFGTAMLRAGGVEVEFVGARRESYTHDSRKPQVEAGTLDDDQRRRDFTINALAWSLNAATFGELVDPFGGLDDLETCTIRTPCDPDITFSDDPLRMMRAVRFATQLGFSIEEETFEAIRRNARRIRIVSRERIATELNKIVLSPVPSMGFELLELTGLLELIFPEMHRLKGVERRGQHAHKDNFVHTLKVLDNVARRSDDLWLRWAAVLHDIAKPLTKAYDPRIGWTFHGHEVLGSKMVPAIFRQLKLPLNEHMKFVQKLVFLHLRPIILSEDLVTDSAVRRLLFEAGDDIEALMTLCEADITSGIDAKVKRYMANFELVRRKMKDLEERDRIRNFQPPITGEIIMNTYGISPCRMIGEIKEAIKNAILDGEIPNEYDAAFELMVRLAAERGLELPDKGK